MNRIEHRKSKVPMAGYLLAVVRRAIRPRLRTIREQNRRDFIRLCEMRFNAPYGPNTGLYRSDDK